MQALHKINDHFYLNVFGMQLNIRFAKFQPIPTKFEKKNTQVIYHKNPPKREGTEGPRKGGPKN